MPTPMPGLMASTMRMPTTGGMSKLTRLAHALTLTMPDTLFEQLMTLYREGRGLEARDLLHDYVKRLVDEQRPAQRE